jgi:serine/threonine-protein kinase HipA
MPLARAEHSHDAISAFLWGLLPDNERTLSRWAQRFQVSPSNVFGLIAHVGEDCAGAAQFVREARLDELGGPGAWGVDWLGEAEVGARLRELREDPTAWRSVRDSGQFSLAGAQPKTALLLRDGRWGVPRGRMPTTHILKPPIAGFDGHAVNEHLCLALARELGLPAASSEVRRFGDEVAIVVERYDRAFPALLGAAAAAQAADWAAKAAAAAASGDPDAATEAAIETEAAAARAEALTTLAGAQPVLRLHQEDLCQALGLYPTFKYQNEGGPSPKDIASLLRGHSSRPLEDVETFFDALVFNWLVGGTDAHAKNYSLLHSGGGRVRLAPLYDLASVLCYEGMPTQKLKLAMKIGGTYRLRDIGKAHLHALATDLGLDPEGALKRAHALAARLPDAMTVVRERATQQGLSHPIVPRLEDAFGTRARRCARALRRAARQG